MKKIMLIFLPLLVLVLSFNTFSLTIKGVVRDGAGNPVPLATVQEKGTKNAVSADVNGAYKITVKSEKAILVFSAVGFVKKEVRLKGRNEINITMAQARMELEEVVVTALGDEESKTYSSPVTKAETEFLTLDGSANGIYGWSNSKQGSFSGRADSSIADYGREGYDEIVENPFLRSTDNPLSTFSIDVDAASYSNVRRFLNAGQLPPAGAVRIEEMINYFHYDYPQPKDEDPFSVNTEISDCPWNKDHKLVLIGLQGKKIEMQNLPPSNLVFLIDVSGSMDEPDKLPLVQQSMKLLTDQLRQDDKVAIVVYAGAAGMVLPSTNGMDKTKIKEAIDGLQAGGSTAGGEGILLAYKTAKENFVKGGNNRVILCTDGDFNVGASSDDELVRMIEKERESGVFLSVLGFGTGNYQDAKMQKLADKGNGNHAYIDGLSEAKKVFVSEFGGTLFAIAKDVKLQIEFNPAKVQGYRLIGYENRLLNKEDFNDDKKDAGELGSGHTVTALYEVIPAGVKDTFMKKVDPLKYQGDKHDLSATATGSELMNIKLRYKKPDGDVSKLIEHAVTDDRIFISGISDNFRFAAAVAEFGMLLRGSLLKSNSSYDNVLKLAKSSLGKDEEGYRSEFYKLAGAAMKIAKVKPVIEEEEEVGLK